MTFRNRVDWLGAAFRSLRRLIRPDDVEQQINNPLPSPAETGTTRHATRRAMQAWPAQGGRSEGAPGPAGPAQTRVPSTEPRQRRLTVSEARVQAQKAEQAFSEAARKGEPNLTDPSHTLHIALRQAETAYEGAKHAEALLKTRRIDRTTDFYHLSGRPNHNDH